MSLVDIDNNITGWVYGGRTLSHGWENVLYGLSTVFIYLLPIVLILLFFRSFRDRLNAIKITLVAMLSWQVLNKLVGSFLYNHYGFRDRPFSFYGLQEFFFEKPAKAFPSDHAAVLMAVALAFFAFKYPKIGWLFLFGGIISSMARVVIGFHYFGDVIGGYIIGTIAFGMVILLDKYLDQGLRKLPLIGILLYKTRNA